MSRSVWIVIVGSLIVSCAFGPGPFFLDDIRGVVRDEDSGEVISGATVFIDYMGVYLWGWSELDPTFHRETSNTNDSGRFRIPKHLSPSIRMWLFRTQAAHFSFYHPSYGLVTPGRLEPEEGEWTLTGSFHASGRKLAEASFYCEHYPESLEARVACPPRHDATFQNGQPRYEGKSYSGGRHGDWTFYYEDGSIAARGQYWNGREVGRWEFYDRRGQLVKSLGCPLRKSSPPAFMANPIPGLEPFFIPPDNPARPCDE